MIMNEETRTKVKQAIISRWDEFELKGELANAIMDGFIFGQYDNNNHIMIDEIWDVVQEVESEG